VYGEELDGPAVIALGVRSQKVSNIGRSSDKWPKIYYLELLRASEDTALGPRDGLWLVRLVGSP
jgi:hypothetical protein